MRILETMLVLTAVLVPVSAAARHLKSSRPARENRDVATVAGPTVVAFFSPVSQAQVDADLGLSEALGDFQYHLSGARTVLGSKGVRVYEFYATSFEVRERNQITVFQPSSEAGGVGYFVKLPGQEALVLNGVHTDSDLVELACRYLHCPGEAVKPK